MEYERIHKVQTGIISPSKLRMKLIGPHHQKKKDGPNSNSSRTSPSKLEDSEFVKNSLLVPSCGDFEDQVPGLDVSSVKLPTEVALDSGHQPKDSLPRENGDPGYTNMHQSSRAESCNLSTVHPLRNLDDECLDYDSNASSSSFEFHKAEKSLHKNSMLRSISRPIPSKWNNAEKWILSNHREQVGSSTKKAGVQGQGSRFPVTNTVRVAPDSGSHDHLSPVNKVTENKRIDCCQPALQIGREKFSFVPPSIHPILRKANGATGLNDLGPQTRDLKEVGHSKMSCAKSPLEDSAALPAIRSVAMRDMGTEMTPIPSQEPSRTATPVGATTPIRSPSSSISSSPRGRRPAISAHSTENNTKDLLEQDLKQRTRNEIVALGVQLGKMNIAAAWESKESREYHSSVKTSKSDRLDRIENEKRAAAWEEAEKSKHLARYKHEEIRIQAWESHEKAKVDAEMRRIEAEVEQLRAEAHAKMAKKIALATQRSEEKRAAAEARRNQLSERATAQAEYIRQTGRIPSSNFICCGWF